MIIKRATIYRFIFLAPALFLVLLFFLLPVLMALFLSVSDVGAGLVFSKFTWENFLRMARDSHVPETLLITAGFVFPTLITFNVGLALILAIVMHFLPERIAAFFRSIWLLPRMAPMVVYAILWIWMLQPTANGLLNQLILLGGGEIVDFLSDYPLLIIILTNGLIGCSMGMLIFSAAIKGIPEHLFLAARVDGATTPAIIRRIILPGIRWQLVFVTMYQAISLLIAFEMVLLITKGGPFYDSTVFAYYTYSRAFLNGQYAYGAALALVLVVIGIIGAIFLWKLSRVDEMFQEPKIEGY